MRYWSRTMLIGGSLLLSGCGGGGGGGSSTPVSPIVGTWRLKSVSSLGQTLNCPGSLSIPGVGAAACSGTETVTYNSDNTFAATGNVTVNGTGISIPGGVNSASGTYTFQNSRLTVTVLQPAQAANRTATGVTSFSGDRNTLTVTGTQNNLTATSVFTRQ